MDDPVALIPAYKPSAAILPELVQRLSEKFRHIVVVDDGSGEACAPIFATLETMPGVSVLRHHTNLGKGAALCTGLNHIAVHFTHSAGVVTLDADGQHLPEDAARVAIALMDHPQALVMGCRDFSKADKSGNNDVAIPFRSRLGNVTSSKILRLLTGIRISDTQTGLRGIPLDFIANILRLRTRGYDFELDMLLLAQRTSRQIIEMPIQTIYINGNASSHFNLLFDSFKVYIVFLRFSISSILTAFLDFLVFSLSMMCTEWLIGSICFARLVAGVFNFTVNRTMVFKSPAPPWLCVAKYAGCVIFMAMLSYAMIQFLLSITQINVYVAKLLTESVLYVFSFLLQREFVFNSGTGDDKNS